MIKLSILLKLFNSLFIITQKPFLCHILKFSWMYNLWIDQLLLRNILLIKLDLIISKRLLILIHLNHLLIRILHPLLWHRHLLRNLLRNYLRIELLLCKWLIFIRWKTHKTNWLLIFAIWEILRHLLELLRRIHKLLLIDKTLISDLNISVRMLLYIIILSKSLIQCTGHLLQTFNSFIKSFKLLTPYMFKLMFLN